MSDPASKENVFVTGGTGYLGQDLISMLLERGHKVRALARRGSEKKVPRGCAPVLGNALDAASYRDRVAPSGTFVHLVGVSHPAPWKGPQFRAIDLASVTESVAAARAGGIHHFVYVSVAHPAPVMKEYVTIRSECEDLIVASGIGATILRPWYVLGPGHWWPCALVPIYWVLERIPATSAAARRCGLVRRASMIRALVQAVENPPRGVRIVEVPEIRRA